MFARLFNGSRAALLTLLVIIVFTNVAIANDDWLVGYWEGHFDDGQVAEIRIRSVSPDGSFRVSWIRRQDPLSGGEREGKIAGGEVILKFSYGSKIFALAELKRSSDGKLLGTLTPSGKSSHRLTITRVSSNWDYPTGIKGCDYRFYSGKYNEFGRPLGTRHVEEGQKEARLGTRIWVVCSHGVLIDPR